MAEIFVRSFSSTHEDSAVDLAYSHKKGDIIEVREDGFDWSPTMIPGIGVIVRVPDLTVQQVRDYHKSVVVDIDFEVLVSNAQGKRIRIFNTDTSVTYAITRQQVETFVTNHGGAVKSVSQNEVVADFPNTTDWTQLEFDIKQALNRFVVVNRYYFSSDDVDQAIAAGGYVTLTPAQLLNKVLDKAP